MAYLKYYPVFAWEVWETVIRTASVSSSINTEYFQNTCL